MLGHEELLLVGVCRGDEVWERQVRQRVVEGDSRGESRETCLRRAR